MVQLDDINWKEAFWFFYWDLLAGDEDHGHANDGFLLAILQLERLPKNATDPPRSCDHLLWHLMRATIYQRGLGSDAAEAGRYRWLDRSPSPTRRPFVDWVDFLDLPWDASLFNVADESFWVLGYLEECAYDQFQGRQEASSMTLTKAWSRNPYLLDFQAAHGLSTPWAVPVPREVDPEPYMVTSQWPFQVVFDTHLGIAHLTSSRVGDLNWLALYEAQKVYTWMLLWVHSMKVTGRLCSIKAFLQCGSGDLPPRGPPGGEQVALCKRLWEAMRQVGYQRLFRTPRIPVAPRQGFILPPIPAKRTAPAILAKELSKKFKQFVKEEEDPEND